GDVSALATYDDGSGPELYAAGSFTEAGGVAVNRIARWDGTVWSPVNEGFSPYFSYVTAMEVLDGGEGPELYVGGYTDCGMPMCPGFAQTKKWNGVSWSSAGGVAGE